jgi:hypothetical protein
MSAHPAKNVTSRHCALVCLLIRDLVNRHRTLNAVETRKEAQTEFVLLLH